MSHVIPINHKPIAKDGMDANQWDMIQTFHKIRKTMLMCNKASSLYYRKLCHIHIKCLKKHGQHTTCVTSFINPHLERLGNEDDLS
jgi:hypothetical protein